jgi:hypothetical protein
MCTVLLAPGDNPIAVNKYISYHVLTLAWPFSVKSLTKEYNKGRFYYRCAYIYGIKIQYFVLKLLQYLNYRLITGNGHICQQVNK